MIQFTHISLLVKHVFQSYGKTSSRLYHASKILCQSRSSIKVWTDGHNQTDFCLSATPFVTQQLRLVTSDLAAVTVVSGKVGKVGANEDEEKLNKQFQLSLQQSDHDALKTPVLCSSNLVIIIRASIGVSCWNRSFRWWRNWRLGNVSNAFLVILVEFLFRLVAHNVTLIHHSIQSIVDPLVNWNQKNLLAVIELTLMGTKWVNKVTFVVSLQTIKRRWESRNWKNCWELQPLLESQ